MRCYVEKNKEKFIEKYAVTGEYIYILKGNKDVETKKYSVLLEKEILIKMRDQVIEAQKAANTKSNIKYSLGYTLALLLCDWSFIRRVITNTPDILNYIGAGLISVLLGKNIVNLSLLFLNERDLNKNNYFLNHEENFNHFNKENSKHLSSVSGKAKKKINLSNSTNPLNINFISNVSSNDLEKINENINNSFDKSNEFSYTYRI